MSVLKIETNDLDSAAESISQMTTKVSDIADTVSGHDVSLDGGVENGDWDFEGVKSKIVSNLEACATKIKNTASALDAVSQSHTKLQNSLKFKDPTAPADDGNGNNKPTGNSTGRNAGSSGGSSGSSGGYSGGYSGGHSGGTSGIVVPTTPKAKKEKEEKEEKVEQKRVVEEEELKTVEVKNNFTKVGYAYADKDNLSEDSKKVFDDGKFKYDDDGYAKIGDRYVIAADPSVGKVGDVIKFTQKDGSVGEAVIGINTSSDKYKDSINFIVSSDKANDFRSTNLTKNLLENNEKIENCGNYQLLDKKLAAEAANNTTNTGTGTTTGTTTTDSSTTDTSSETTTTTETNSEEKPGPEKADDSTIADTSNETTTTEDKPETIVTPVDNADNPNNGNNIVESETTTDNATTEASSDSTTPDTSNDTTTTDTSSEATTASTESDSSSTVVTPVDNNSDATTETTNTEREGM